MKFKVLTALTAMFICVFSKAVDVNVYDGIIKLASHDPNYKCPYLLSSFLESRPAYLKNCIAINNSIKKVETNNVEDALCLLFYNNFENLCFATTSMKESDLLPIVPKNIVQSPEMFGKPVEDLCITLKTNRYFLNNLQDSLKVIQSYLSDSHKCKRICTDFDENVKPICSVTAFIVDATNKLQNKLNANKQQEQDQPNKNDELETTPNKNAKPKVTEHIGEVSGAIDTVVKAQSHDLHDGNIPKSVDLNNSITYTDNSKHKSLTDNKNEYAPSSHFIDSFNRYDLMSLDQTSAKQIKSNIQEPVQNVQNHDGYAVQMPGEHEEDINTAIKMKTISVNGNNQSPVSLNDVPVTQFGLRHDAQPPSQPMNSENGIKNTGTKKQVALKENSHVEVDENVNVNENLLHTNEEKLLQQNLPAKKQTEDKPIKHKDILNETPKNSQIQKDLEVPADIPETLNPFDEQDEDDDINIMVSKSDKSKPKETDEDETNPANAQSVGLDDGESYFFSYFMMVCILFIGGYVAFHNKQRILALVLEGRKGRRPARTRRPNSANYHKLDSNLEEAVTSSCSKNAPQVIY